VSDQGSDELEQPDLFEADEARTILERLIAASRLYTYSRDYKDLLSFVARLRNFAPYNAMLLHIQKPAMRYAASAHDWRERFGRQPKRHARPLLILWPFGPVALVYDVQDTEGKPLPEDVDSFFAQGPIDETRIASFLPLLARRGIEWSWVDAGDGFAGEIEVVRQALRPKERSHYRLFINRNHAPPTQFATLVHELGHLFLGHLGKDVALRVPARPVPDHALGELEAESVTYLTCTRKGVIVKSQTYLTKYVDGNTTSQLDIYRIMSAAGRVESVLGLAAVTRFDKPKGSRRNR
jgi:hypothetical protein